MLIVTFKNDAPTIMSQADFTNLIAAIEFVLPWTRGHLLWVRAVLEGWNISGPVNHALPLPDALMIVFAAAWWLAGFRRIAKGLWLQKRLGLRPNELLNLEAADIFLPEDVPGGHYSHGVLNLGARTGTKMKRAQASLLKPHSTELAFARDLRKGLQAKDKVFGSTQYPQYSRLLDRTCGYFRVLPYKAHSPRAGCATDSWLAGIDFVSIREQLRHQNDRSLRVYLDTVSAYAALTRSDGARWGELAAALEPAFARAAQSGDLEVPPSRAANLLKSIAGELAKGR